MNTAEKLGARKKDRSAIEEMLRTLHALFLHFRGRSAINNRVTAEYFRRDRKSDTVFILGTGQSINRISEAKWRAIRSSDSIGFNWFLLHEHAPKWLHYEPWPQHEEEFIRYYIDRVRDGYRARLILNATHPPRKVATHDLLRSVSYLQTYPVRFSDTGRRMVERTIQVLGTLSAARWLPFEDVFVHQAGSLGLLVHMAINAGYRRIVLCGIDLNNSQYFYDDRERYGSEAATFASSSSHAVLSQLYSFAGIHQASEKTEHPTAIKETTSGYEVTTTMIEDICMLNDLAKRKGISLQIESSQSALYPMLSLWDGSSVAPTRKRIEEICAAD